MWRSLQAHDHSSLRGMHCVHGHTWSHGSGLCSYVTCKRLHWQCYTNHSKTHWLKNQIRLGPLWQIVLLVAVIAQPRNFFRICYHQHRLSAEMPDKHLPVRLPPVRQQLRRPDPGVSRKLELRGALRYYGSQANGLGRQQSKMCATKAGSRLRTRP